MTKLVESLAIRQKASEFTRHIFMVALSHYTLFYAGWNDQWNFVEIVINLLDP